ncbi:MAG: helix-turn-helix transcriptional regulator [Pelobium sp.]
MKNLPVYDLTGLEGLRHPDVLVNEFEPYLKLQHRLHLPHGHSFYHIVFFTDAKGKHIIDFDTYEVNPFQIYFMIPGQVHEWKFEGIAKGYVLNFSESFFNSFLLRKDYLEEFPFFHGDTRKSIINIPDELKLKVEHLFKNMLVLKPDFNANGLDELRVLMLQLFFRINSIDKEDVHGKSTSYNMVILRNFQKLIDQNFTTLRLPKDYAALLFITPNHLNAITAQLLGISAGALIRKRILLEAKRLLVNLDVPISEIGYQLNFRDNSYFTKFFKKQEACTPEEFRKRILNSK